MTKYPPPHLFHCVLYSLPNKDEKHLIPSVSKGWHFWIVCQIWNVKYFCKIFKCMNGWRSHLSNDTKNLKNYLCLGEHWPLLFRVWKLGCGRIQCGSNVAEREFPQYRNCWWSDEFMINYDRYWFVLCMTSPTFCPHSTQPHPTPPHPTTCTVTLPRTPSNTITKSRQVMLTTLPQSKGNCV